MNLKNYFLFQNLDEKDLKEIKKFTIIKKLKKDDIVFYEKENPSY